jgi:CPA2 family monovalent cation:H+ antiporter-2
LLLCSCSLGSGLHFHPPNPLRATGKKGGTGIAVIEVLVILGLGFAVGAGLGWPLYDAIFLASALSITISSTAILVKVLEEMSRMESNSAILMIWIYTYW